MRALVHQAGRRVLLANEHHVQVNESKGDVQNMKIKDTPFKKREVSDNIRIVFMQSDGQCDVVDLRRMDKKERKKYVNLPRLKDFLEEREWQKERAASAATVPASPGDETAPTTVESAKPSREAASGK